MRNLTKITLLFASCVLFVGCAGLTNTVRERTSTTTDYVLSQDYTVGVTWLGKERRLQPFASVGTWNPAKTTPALSQPVAAAEAVAFVIPVASGESGKSGESNDSIVDGKRVRTPRRRIFGRGRRETPEPYVHDDEDTDRFRNWLVGKRTYISLIIAFVALVASWFGWHVEKDVILEILLQIATAIGILSGIYYRWRREAPIRNKKTSTTPGGKFNPNAEVRKAIEP